MKNWRVEYDKNGIVRYAKRTNKKLAILCYLHTNLMLSTYKFTLQNKLKCRYKTQKKE